MAFDAAFDIGLQDTVFSSGTFVSLAVGGVNSGAWDIGDHTPVEFASGVFSSVTVGGVFGAVLEITSPPVEFCSGSWVGTVAVFDNHYFTFSVGMRLVAPGDDCREILWANELYRANELHREIRISNYRGLAPLRVNFELVETR